MELAPLDDDWERAVCIVAHPDDLEYGTSVAVARWTAEGRKVMYVLATSGEAGIDGLAPERCRPLREQEERAAAAAVGVDVVEFLGHPDGAVEYGLPLRRDLARAIRRHRPHLIVTAHFGLAWGPGPGGPANQADHRHVGLAALDAARDAGNRWIFTELVDEGFEPWSGCRQVAVGGTSAPTHVASVERAHIEAGIASLEAHKAYFAGLGSEFNAREFLSTQLGGGDRFAVPFEVYQL